MLDLPFLTGLPVKRIITSRLPSRNTVGFISQISLLSKPSACQAVKEVLCVCLGVGYPLSFS